MIRVVVEGVRNSEEGLVGQADPEGLEAGTQTRAVTRAAAQPQFTEAGMSRVRMIAERDASSRKHGLKYETRNVKLAASTTVVARMRPISTARAPWHFASVCGSHIAFA